FKLKGGLFPLTTLQIFNLDLIQLKAQLTDKIQQAPNFFHHAPIVLDFKIANQPNIEIDFTNLKAMLLEINLIPVAIRNATPDQIQAAIKAGFAILRDNPTPHDKEKLSATTQPTPKILSSKIITEPVR